jgi:hypothetical protein
MLRLQLGLQEPDEAWRQETCEATGFIDRITDPEMWRRLWSIDVAEQLDAIVFGVLHARCTSSPSHIHAASSSEKQSQYIGPRLAAVDRTRVKVEHVRAAIVYRAPK